MPLMVQRQAAGIHLMQHDRRGKHDGGWFEIETRVPHVAEIIALARPGLLVSESFHALMAQPMKSWVEHRRTAWPDLLAIAEIRKLRPNPLPA
ncbi:MAG: hypothetical protein WDO73_02710 [Ignavibacteriota bacterium]